MKLKKYKQMSLFKSASIYTLTNIINALIPFLLIPVLTRYLTPADYGMTAMMQVMIGFVTPFVGLNLQGAISVKYYQKDQIDFPQYVSNCFFVLVASSILLTICVVFFNHQISRLTSFPIEWIWSIILICFGQFLISVVLTILQVSVKPKTYASLQISQIIMNFTLSLWFIAILHYNWQGRVIAQVITISFFCIVGIILLKKWGLLNFSYKKKYMIDALKFGIPLIPHTLSGYFVSMADRYLITNMIGLEATGIYAVGAQVGMAMQLLAHSFNQAYSPWLFRILSKPSDEMKKKIVKLTYAYFVVILLIALMFSFIMPVFLQYYLGDKFHGSGDYVFGIALAGAFNGMYFMVVNYIFYIGKTYILAYVTFTMGVVHVFNTYWAILCWGSVGATYSSALTGILTFIIVWLLSAKFYPMPWLFKKS